jgi:hypothetical protein
MCYYHEVIEVREYLDRNDRSPFGKWFLDLDATAAAKVGVSLKRIELGNLSEVTSVGGAWANTRSTLAPVIASILAETETHSSYFWPADRPNGRPTTQRTRGSTGRL